MGSIPITRSKVSGKPFMDARAAVAWEAGKPLAVGKVQLAMHEGKSIRSVVVY
ncbi:MAG TPA: hypothetical protein VHI32_04445 [Burkholderiales bacterium]|nr:hypothetical protein [Burkholderiales bacterium]